MDTELVELRERIENVKAEKVSLEGEKKAVLARLKKDYGVTSISQAEKKLNDLEKDIRLNEKRRTMLLQKIDSALREMEE